MSTTKRRRSNRRTCDLALDTTLEPVQAKPVKYALKTTIQFTGAVHVTASSIPSWTARIWHRRKRMPIIRIQVPLGQRRTKARVEARKDAMDGELTTLQPCMHKRASRFMSQSCLRLNLAAPELIRVVVFTFIMIMLQQFLPLLRRDTRWSLR